MEFPVQNRASDEESPVEEFVDINNSQQNRTLAYQMVIFVYDRLAIDRDARTLAFWEEFRVLHGNVVMSANELRDFFYLGLMEAAEHLETLPYHVRRYINPMFNRYRGEVLRQQESLGLWYDRQTRRSYVSANSSKLPLELLLEAPSNPVTSGNSHESYRLPTTEQVLRFVSGNLSELLWTEEEKLTKVPLSMAELLERMAVLTRKGISLGQCAEPGMKCYNRMRLLGLLPESDGVPSPAQVEDVPEKGSYLEDFRTPINYSTPFEPRSEAAFRKKQAPTMDTLTLMDSGYDRTSFQGPSIRSTPRPTALESVQRMTIEERLQAMQDDGQQPCCSYRKPK